MIRTSSIAVLCGSHPYENLMVTTAGALAICDESEVARRALELIIHYIIGITNGFGEDECWNEGAGYGNGKMKWLMDATWYLQTALPALNLGKNEAYSAYCDFFARLTPIGAQHTSFGNRGINERDWCTSRITNFRRVAILRHDAVAMQNWLDTRRRLSDLGVENTIPYSPWVDYVLPYYGKEPKPRVERRTAKLFPLEGWVTVSSAPPSDYDAQKNAVSMTFHCRPRGGYSHSFRSENAFDIHAYGETIAVGGGTTSNQSYFADSTMSHNTILVNGKGQLGSKGGGTPICGRIIAYREGKDFVYWAGDATPAYGAESGLARFIRHVVFVKNQYFVIFDDLRTNPDSPATFQWLYHITPFVPLEFDRDTFAIRYTVGKTRVILRHMANTDQLTFRDLRGAKGMVNPITGEDLTRMDKLLRAENGEIKVPPPLDAHHIWISTTKPEKRMQFLSVIVPYRDGESEPKISPAGKLAVKVRFRRAENMISFSNARRADIVVDAEGIARLQIPLAPVAQTKP